MVGGGPMNGVWPSVPPYFMFSGDIASVPSLLAVDLVALARSPAAQRLFVVWWFRRPCGVVLVDLWWHHGSGGGCSAARMVSL
ncbi:hypothetical protein A2U01_0065039 [Trifolium medium]|uniref:Uncharacterized protein n=1 Tax=Trifolium medium TaxID=97028 RepID=A0A392S4H4_9FABA|nr:hypothetical protein [Trifolium medium]